MNAAVNEFHDHDPLGERCEECGCVLIRGLCWDEDCLAIRQRQADAIYARDEAADAKRKGRIEDDDAA